MPSKQWSDYMELEGWSFDDCELGVMMNIGDLRRSLFMDFNCRWNAVVRDITASNESHDEETDEVSTYVGLLEAIKVNAYLDRQFPRSDVSRVQELFVETK